jgi:hypothetical protein
VAGPHDVAERDARIEFRGIVRHRFGHLHQRAVGVRNAHELRLAAVLFFTAEEIAVEALRLQAGTAEIARVVAPRKRRDHRVAFPNFANVAAEFFYDADEFVPGAPSSLGCRNTTIEP